VFFWGNMPKTIPPAAGQNVFLGGGRVIPPVPRKKIALDWCGLEHIESSTLQYKLVWSYTFIPLIFL